MQLGLGRGVCVEGSGLGEINLRGGHGEFVVHGPTVLTTPLQSHGNYHVLLPVLGAKTVHRYRTHVLSLCSVA